MSGLCGRHGCNAPVTAIFRFDGRAQTVWLDDPDQDRLGWGGRLCTRHADRLTPPRGWHLLDRRTVKALPADSDIDLTPQEEDTPLLARAFRGARAS